LIAACGDDRRPPVVLLLQDRAELLGVLAITDMYAV
jgi:hypothetical protein